MELETKNREYLIAKKGLEDVKKELEGIKKRHFIALNNRQRHIVARNDAELKKDEITKNNEQKEIDKLEREINDIEKELENKKTEFKSFETIINDKIEELKEDPDLKQTMDYALMTRYERQIKKLQRDKGTAVLQKSNKERDKINSEDKLKRYENLKQLITEHPALKNNLNGILAAKEEIKKLNDELAILDYQKDAKRIAEIQGKDLKDAKNKLDKNKKPLMDYIDKNKINVKYKDIEEMADKGIGLDDSIKGLKKDIKDIDGEIKGYNEQIKGYDKEIEKYGIASNNIKNGMNKERQGTEHGTEQESDLKWYQIIKRFKNWNEKRKNPPKSLPAPAQNKPNIRDALKYEIMKDAVGYDEKTKVNKKQVIVDHVYGKVEKDQLRAARKQQRQNSDDGSR